jgi:hypothetical protein
MPYAAIFEAASAAEASAKATEAMLYSSANQPYAELRGWLTDGGYVATGSGSNALFTPAGATTILVDVSGNVGIGTTTPAARLDVAGDARINGLTVGRGAATWPPTGAGQQRLGGTGRQPQRCRGLPGPAVQHHRLQHRRGRQALTTTPPATMPPRWPAGAVLLDGHGQHRHRQHRGHLRPTTSQYRALRHLLGYGATKDNAAALTNGIAIGANARVLQSNQVVLGNDSITTTLLKGSVGIGTASPGYKLEVAGAAGATVFTSTSDIRFKRDIAPLKGSLARIELLRGVSYRWRKDEFAQRGFDDKAQVGFIAQELEQVLPELVSTGADGFKSVAYTGVIPVVVEAVKELHTLIRPLLPLPRWPTSCS